MDDLLREIAAEKERVKAALSALEKTLRCSYGSALRWNSRLISPREEIKRLLHDST